MSSFDARQFAVASRSASRALVSATTEQKDAALAAMAKALRAASAHIVGENALDLDDAQKAGKNAAFIDRLELDVTRVEAMAAAVDAVRALPDPVGEVTERWTRPNGLRVRKERLPLGVVLMIYESRPNVTSDAAALCLKSGNAAMLRGGSESFRSNRAIERALQLGLAEARLPPECIQLVPTTDRESMLELLKLDGLIDLCIPRGGEGLIRFVVEHARVPVVKHYQGVCHVFVEKTADLEVAEKIIVNAKTSRPGVCNAAECLLVDAAIADQFLPRAAKALKAKNVELRADERALKFIDAVPAKADDFGREFLELILAVKVVDGFDDALVHIARYGSEHTEAIVTKDDALAKRFTREVTASAVVVNASTRFNDGGELGLGAEVGISTSRLHAFGPMGLRELTAQKYVVEGDGQIR
ncbi:MAG: glutamate-5-semialdehyde dehydrogenase [Archangium sp.]